MRNLFPARPLGFALWLAFVPSGFAATIQWTNTTGGNWNVAANWSPNQVPDANDDALITTAGNYTVTINSTLSVSNLAVGGAGGGIVLQQSSGTFTLNGNGSVEPDAVFRLTSGALTGPGTLVLDGLFQWNGGIMSGGGLTRANGPSILGTTANKSLDGRAFLNAGPLLWTNGSVLVYAGAVISNLAGATFELTFDGTASVLSGNGSFDNAGLVRKSGGTGTATWNWNTRNTGRVEVQSGALSWGGSGTHTGEIDASAGASHRFTGTQTLDGTPLSGAGAIVLAGTLTISNTVTASSQTTFRQDGGTLTGLGALVLDGPFQWNGGTMSGSGLTRANGPTAIGGTANKALNGRPFLNAGQLLWTNGTVVVYAGAVISNLAGATFELTFDGTASIFPSNGSFDNAGLVRKSGGTGTAIWNWNTRNTGRVEVQSGALSWGGSGTHTGELHASAGASHRFTGTQTLDGAPLSGEGAIVLAGTLTISNTVTASSQTTFRHDSGTLIGPGALMLDGPLQWNGGMMRGGGLTRANGPTVFGGTANKELNGRAFLNAGPLFWTNGTVSVYAGGVISNLAGATFELTFDGPASIFTGNGSFDNAGLVRKSGGTGAATWNWITRNTGRVEVQSGALNWGGSGTHTGEIDASAGASHRFTGTQTLDGTPLSGAGTIVLVGTLTISNTVTASSQTTFRHDGTLIGPGALMLDGPFQWNGGMMRGGGLTRANGPTVFGGTAHKELNGRTFLNAGPLFWTNGTVSVYAGGVISNLAGATFELTFDGPASIFTGNGSFDNAGLVRKSGGTGTASWNWITRNRGTVEARSGTLNFGGPFTQTAGLTLLDGGALGSGPALQLLGGVLAGTNTITGSVSNSAVIRPGAANGEAPGRLVITGNYTQTASGALDIQLGGLLPGGEHDTLAVSGTATLAGALNVSLLGGFTPTAGNEFGVLTAGTRSGFFTQFTPPPGDPPLELLHTNNLVLVRALNGPPAYPDLQVTALNVTAPTLAAGQTLTIAWRDTNAGSAITPAGWSDRVIVSNTTTRVTLLNSTLAYNAVTLGPLPAGGSVQRQTTLKLPDGTNGAGAIRVTVQTDVLNQIFEFSTNFNAEANNLAELTVVSAATDYPDLVVTNISGPPTGLPGQSVPVVWTVRNLGPAAATGSWSEQIFLSSDPVPGSDTYLRGVSITGPLAPGASITRTQSVTLPSLGTGAKFFVVTVDAGHSLFEQNETNNSAVAAQSITLPAALALQLPASRSEDASSVSGTVTRNDPGTNTLAVSLTSSAPGRAAVPASVVIAAGQTSAGFTVALTGDTLALGDLPVQIIASAANHTSVTNTLTLVENDTAHLTLLAGLGTVAENAGTNAIAGSISRNAFTNSALVVGLSSSRPEFLFAPSTVTIPAGSLTAFFSFGPVDNTTIDGTREVTLQAGAEGFNSTSTRIEVTDNDTVTLSLSFTENSVTEGGPSPATIGTLTRSPVTANPLTVSLAASNGPLLQFPRSLTLAAGQEEASFSVNVGNDTLANGTRLALLTATAQAANGTLVANTAVSAPLTILDNDGPTLQLTLAATTIAESGGTTSTVTRNTPATNALLVNLTSDNPGEATVPATVTIPLNSASATFPVSGVSDGTTDGVKPVNLSASAAGFNPAAAQLNVTDIDLPDFTPTAIGPVNTNAFTDTALEISWTVANHGLATAAGDWVDRVYLSRNAFLDSKDLLLTSFTNSGALAAAASYSRTRTVLLPPTPGAFWLIVETDASGAFTETSERNNTLSSAQPLQIQPAYRAEVFTDITVTTNGLPIPLHGRVFKTDDLSPAPFKLATVRVRVNDIRRVIPVLSDSAGNFAAVFNPLPTEAGCYFIGADHPRVEQDSTNDTFIIVGMKADPRSLDLVLVPEEARLGSFQLRNRSREPLTGLAVSAVNLPSGVNATAMTAEILPGAGTNTVSFSFATTLTNAIRFGCALRVTSAEGAVIEVPVTVEVRPLRPQLVANPGSLVRGMLRGVQAVVSFEVSNLGGAPSGDLQVLLPDNTPWMSLASTSNVPSLAPGATTVVTLRLSPPSDLPLILYQGTLALVGSSASVGVPFQFRALSEAEGDLLVSVTDELTYFTTEAPRVTNATVIVRDGYTAQVIASGVTGTNGQVLLTGLAEGDYVLEASAAKHTTYRGKVTIVPGVTTEKEAFLSKQTVTYRWNVVPTEIEDRYKIVLESTFETEVPAPVVVVENPRIMPLVIGERTSQFEIRLRNEGLIAAHDVEVTVPNDPVYEITPLIKTIDVFPAKSRMNIPVTIRRRPAGQFIAAAGGGCTIDLKCLPPIPVQVHYNYVCGGNGVEQVQGVNLTPFCTQETDCLDDLADAAGGAFSANFGAGIVTVDFSDAGCDLLHAAIECLAGELSPCTALALDAACGAAAGALEGGALGAAAGAAGGAAGNLDCICDHLPSLPPSSASSFGGGISGYTLNFGAYASGLPINVPGTDCSGLPQFGAAGFRAAAGPNGVCARVRIRTEQEAVLTRTAFRGTLELDNEGATPLTGVQLTLDIRDGNDLPAGERFVTTGPVLGGALTGADGGGTLPAAASGTAIYTFIPTRDAAPNQPAIYQIGGTLRYIENGQEVTVPLLSSPISVFPEARLVLDYFQQRDVYSDDPFTAEVEPAEPFALGLIVKNVGAGAARNFRITSAQPQIIENEKGLLIDFKIIGTQVGSQEISPSLTANLGNIPPAGARAARWLFVSTLQGKFIDYSASFEHLDSLGSVNLSLIDQVSIHELIHAVRDDRPGADAEPDFLVNDVPDAEDLPDTIYLSSGALEVVTVIDNAVADGPATASDRVVQLTATMTSGWNYLMLPDPGPNFRLERVVRSDGKQLRVGDNAWQTDRSFPNSVIGAVRERLLHLLDHDGTSAYTLHYGIDDSEPPQIVSVLGPPANPVTASVSSVDVTFSEAIDGGTFTRDDVTLTRNGGANLIDGGVSIASVNSTAWRINGLAALTGADGNYVLTVLGVGIRDFGSNAALNSASVAWAKGTATPVVVQVGPVSPNPRNTAVATVDAIFSLPLDAATFTREDVTLTRNGGANLVTPGVAIDLLTPTTFRVANLAALTPMEGAYVLTINAAGVTGTNGAAGLGSLSLAWTNDTTGPALVELEEIRTNPRNIVVPTLDVTFSETIFPASFTRADVTLLRDGGPNLVTSDINVSQLSPLVWRVSGINWNSGQPGTYTFTVNAAGITDLAGNAGVGSLSRTWVMDTQPPPPPSALALVPDTGASATDGLINTNRPVLSGSVSETNVTVRVFDLTLDRDRGGSPSVGLSFTHALELEPGAHRLRVRAVDSAANVSSDVFLNVFVDLSAPVVSLAPITPELQETNVNFVDVFSTEPLDLASFTTADFTLTRNDGTNLIDAAVTITPLTTNSYRVANLGPLNAGVGFYELVLDASTVADRAGNAGSGRLTNRWTRTTGNAAPDLAAIADAVINEGTLFTFTAQATDSDPGDVLSFAMTGAPSGAHLDPQSGLFEFQPDELAGPRTNLITITVADNGIPQRSASRSFRLIVRNTLPDFSVSLGSTNVFAGESNALPLVLVSGVSLTNVILQLDIPPGQLPRVALNSSVPDLLTADLIPLGGARHELRLGFDPTRIQNGVRRVGQLSFSTDSNQPSALVRLPLSNPMGRRLTGQLLTQAGANGGHLVIVRDQPVLIALPGGEIEVFAVPGSVYQLESSSELPAGWSTILQFHYTNTLRLPVVVPAGAPQGTIFYRLRE